MFQVVRSLGKRFSQRRPDGNDGWICDRKGVTPILYRLPELLAAPGDTIVCIVEGEKDVESLRSLGFIATCNPGGAGKFTPELREPLKDRRAVVIADKDVRGRSHAQQVAQVLYGFAASAKVLELPGERVKDAADWVTARGTREELERLANEAAEWMPGDPGNKTEVGESGLPQIDVSGRHLRDIAKETWDILALANDLPFVFQRGHPLMDIIDNDPNLTHPGQQSFVSLFHHNRLLSICGDQ